MALDSLQYFFQRIPRLNYVSPPICETEFSSSAFPTIVLSTQYAKVGPTGLEFFSLNGRVFLRWNNYPGAICFSVYKAVDELDPFGDYTLVAECVPSPVDIDSFGPGTYRVSALTLQGESSFSETVTVPPGAGAGGAVVTIAATQPNTEFDSAPGVFRISRTGTTVQPVTVFYTFAGTAVNGVNYDLIPSSTVIPAGQSFVDIFIVALDLGTVEETDVVLTIVPSVQLDYAVGNPQFAQVIIAAQVACLYRIVAYEGNPFTPPAGPATATGPVWDGTFKASHFVDPVTTYYAVNELELSADRSIGNKQVFSLGLASVPGTSSLEVYTDGLAEGNKVWRGIAISATPAGVYTRVDGSDLRATITIEAC